MEWIIIILVIALIVSICFGIRFYKESNFYENLYQCSLNDYKDSYNKYQSLQDSYDALYKQKEWLAKELKLKNMFQQPKRTPNYEFEEVIYIASKSTAPGSSRERDFIFHTAVEDILRLIMRDAKKLICIEEDYKTNKARYELRVLRKR